MTALGGLFVLGFLFLFFKYFIAQILVYSLHFTNGEIKHCDFT